MPATLRRRIANSRLYRPFRSLLVCTGGQYRRKADSPRSGVRQFLIDVDAEAILEEEFFAFPGAGESLQEILEADRWAREYVKVNSGRLKT